MKDRFTVGMISGIIAGVVTSLANIGLIVVLRFGNVRFIDFSGVFIYGRIPSGSAEELFAWTGYLAFTAFLGILFAYAVPHLTSQNLLLKSIAFGIAVWFTSYALTYLFQTPYLNKISLHSALSNFISSCVYGVSLGLVYQRIWKRKRIFS